MSINDKICTWFKEKGYSGALNNMLSSYLKDQGYSGSLSDMLGKVEGYKSFVNSLTSSSIQDLVNEGIAFDLLDESKMYKDREGTQLASEEGDTVLRINSEVEGSYLVDNEGTGAVLTKVNGKLVLSFNDSLFELVGYSARLAQPIIAHGTMNVTSETNILYWYNKEGTGYSPRKWGVILRPSQYRTFYNDGNITVVGVPEWQSYHDVYWNRPEGEITIDGVKNEMGGSSAELDETYDPSDGGFRLGGYPGNTSESLNGVVTYFILTSQPLDEKALREFTNKHKAKVIA